MIATQHIHRLHELDKGYNRLLVYASHAEKMKYCHFLLERSLEFLRNNRPYITEHMRNRTMQIVEATRMEIAALSGINQ